ncbi:MAG: hypothetical protein QM679_10055 [Patulibacter sp.]
MIYEFHLELDGDPDPHLDALFNAELDDGTFGTHVDGTGDADFHRDAPSFWDAVVSAIDAIESSTPLHVTSVDADQLLTGADVAEELGVSRQHLTRIAKSDGFPAPVQRIGPRVVLYSRNAVLAWAWTAGRLATEPATPTARELDALGSLNAALAWRAGRERLDRRSRAYVERIAA